jgi:pectin-derived oligosaccharide transport system substrate-binding protein
MKQGISRRDFNRLLGAGAAAGTLASTGSLAFADERVRLIWWGNPERDKRTLAVVDLYQKENPGVTIDPENYAWADYWTKLGTMAAGQNLPDVIQMDYRYIFEYARRGQLAALDPFIGQQIDLADFDKSQLDSGKVDDKTYGISLGANSMSWVYNKTLFDKLGLSLPDPTKWTLDDFGAMGNDVKGKLPDGMYFMSNKGNQENQLETWTRQRGKGLYTDDGKLAYELDDLVAFWEYWYKMQESGLTPPADVQAVDTGKMEEMMMLNGHSLFDFLHSNQLVACQKLSKDEVGMTMIPNQTGGKPGQYMKPSMLLSMAENSTDKEGAAKLMSFFLTDEGANDILLIERGVTGDASVRKHIAPKLTDTENKIIDYLNVVSTWVGPLPPPPPKGAGEIDRNIEAAWQAIAFKQKKLEDGAKEFYDFCQQTLERA